MARLFSNMVLRDAFERALVENGYGVLSIDVKDYIRAVKVSEKTRAKGYKLNDSKLPKWVKAMLANGECRIGKNGIITDIYGQLLVKNRQTVNKERFIGINGQQIYNGNIHYTVRSRIVKEMKAYFEDAITGHLKRSGTQLNTEVVGLGIDVYRPPRSGDSTWDLDNYVWIYHKVIQDVLVDVKLIDADDVDHIDFIGPYFYAESTDYRMVINIYTRRF